MMKYELVMTHQNGVDDPAGDDPSRVCRDFLRNVCRRGRWCRYLHPANITEVPPEAAAVSPHQMGRSELTFCHDYQNKMCARSNCRFLHCSREEEEFFRSTGELPTHVMEAALRKGLAPDLPLGRGEVPFCKDYLKGNCARGAKCKFRHVSSNELEMELLRLRARRRELDRHEAMTAAMEPMLAPPEPKRRHCEEPIMALRVTNTPTALGVGALVLGLAPQGTAQPATMTLAQPQQTQAPQTQIGLQMTHPVEMHLVDDENLMLRRKIEELKKQVSDLTATNEFLLDQNAQLRLMSKQSTNVTTVSLPAVTITNTVPVSAVSTVHVTPLVTPICQPISVTRVVTPQPTSNSQPQPPTVAVPVSLAAAVPLTQLSTTTAVVPLTQLTTSTAVSIAAPAPALTAVAVSIAQSRVAAQQQQTAQQPQSLSIPISISGATAPLMTYPIITQTPALRPQP